MNKIVYIRYTTSYDSLYHFLKDFMKDMIKLPNDTPKSKVWIDAFKGEGAYYTLKNLVMFHDCVIYENIGNYHDGRSTIRHRGVNAVQHLKYKLDEYQGEGWRMFALMKKVISDNNINTKTHIVDICNK